MQFLLIVVRAYLNVVKVSICCRYTIEMTITDKALVQGDVGCSEDRTALTTTVCITLDGWDAIYETCAVFLTDDDVCLTKNVTRCASTDSASVVTYAALPAATIDVTCCTAFDIGVGRSDKRVVEVISSYRILIVHRTHGSCGVEVLCYLTSKQSYVGCSVNVARVRRVGITKSTTVCIGTAKATVVHITTDISAFVDDNVGIVFLAVSIRSQIIVQTGICIFAACCA